MPTGRSPGVHDLLPAATCGLAFGLTLVARSVKFSRGDIAKVVSTSTADVRRFLDALDTR